MDPTTTRLQELRMIPVVKLDRAEDADLLAQALRAGGLPCAEITLRTAAALDTIERLATAHRGFLVGAGTVLDVDQADRAIAAGAQFVVSPGLDEEVVAFCQTRRVPVFPGIATPTDVLAARKLGLSVVKFFPAEALGGVKTLDALRGPFPGMRFIPTGGIHAKNAPDYLAHEAVFAVGGSFMVPTEAIADGDTHRLTERTRAAVQLVRAASRP